MTTVMCGWCHTSCPAGERRCPSCGHEPGVSRLDCRCPDCRRRAGDRDDDDRQECDR